MKIILGSFSILLTSLVIVLFFYGEDKPLSDFIEKIILGSFSVFADLSGDRYVPPR